MTVFSTPGTVGRFVLRVCYPARMRSELAEFLRQRAADEVLAMSPAERMALALTLGDEDLDRYVAASGLDRDSALRNLRRARSIGRRPSVANDD